MDGQNPAGQAPPSFEAGWYPDPYGQPVQRYWDGTRWSAHIHDGTNVVDESSPAVWLGRLSTERMIVYRERSAAAVGGRIDLVSGDGRLLGWSQAAPGQASSSHSYWAPEVWSGLFAANGVLLGSFRRPRAREPGVTHLVVDPGGVPVGQFERGAFLTTTVEVRTGQGLVASANYNAKESWVFDANRAPLAHVKRSTPGGAIHWFMPIATEMDTFSLEPVAPVPPWMFLLILFTPIDLNIRLDSQRASQRSSAGSV